MTAAVAEEFGPEFPRNWDPNDPSLTDPKAPHETAGVYRMHRGGMTGPQIAEVLNLPVGPQLMQQMQRGMDQEAQAYLDDRPIFDGTKDEEE